MFIRIGGTMGASARQVMVSDWSDWEGVGLTWSWLMASMSIWLRLAVFEWQRASRDMARYGVRDTGADADPYNGLVLVKEMNISAVQRPGGITCPGTGTRGVGGGWTIPRIIRSSETSSRNLHCRLSWLEGCNRLPMFSACARFSSDFAAFQVHWVDQKFGIYSPHSARIPTALAHTVATSVSNCPTAPGKSFGKIDRIRSKLIIPNPYRILIDSIHFTSPEFTSVG